MIYKGTILQFDSDYRLNGEYTGSLDAIMSEISDGDRFYYRFPAFQEIGTREKVRYSHFGVNGINVSCNNYSAEELLHYCLNYSVRKYYKKKREAKTQYIGFEIPVFYYAMQLQVADWLSKNNSKDFNERLDAFLNRHPEFIQVFDLNECRGKCGIYILVLDYYNVCYIGQTQSSLLTRIKQHWTRNDYFQRGIDRFKAMDTTRVFIYPIDDPELINKAEYELVPDFPEQYTLNCGSTGGDVWYKKNHMPLANIEPTHKEDNLLQYIELAERILGVSKE